MIKDHRAKAENPASEMVLTERRLARTPTFNARRRDVCANMAGGQQQGADRWQRICQPGTRCYGLSPTTVQIAPWHI